MPETPQPSLPFSRELRDSLSAIPEMELEDFRKLLKAHFGIGCEPTDREYLVRFVGQPFDENKESCRAISVMAHSRGKTLPLHLSPHNILQVLSKFEIPERNFQEAYQMSRKKVEPIRPTAPTASNPSSVKPVDENKEAS